MGFLCVHLQIDVYTIDGINSSDILCRQLSVQSVYFDLNTLSRQNYFFQRVWGVFKILVEIPDGWGGVTFVVKKWKFRRGGGSYVKFPLWWGYGYFLEPHNTVKVFPFTASLNSSTYYTIYSQNIINIRCSFLLQLAFNFTQNC